MNRILFDTLTFLNGFIAIIAIGVCTWLGSNMPAFSMMRPIGALLGAGVGLALAAILCGTLAYFALMERHMRTIAESISAGNSRTELGSLPSAGRQEPRL